MAVARSLTFGCRVVGSSICPIGAAEHAPSDRLRIALKQCVAAKGYPKVAALMSMGVIVGGGAIFCQRPFVGATVRPNPEVIGRYQYKTKPRLLGT